MRHPGVITLFADPPSSNGTPSPVLISIFLHGVAFGLLTFGLKYATRIEIQPVAHRYTVRYLKLQEPPLHWSAQTAASAPAAPSAPASAALASARQRLPATPSTRPEPSVDAARTAASPSTALQTLLQPDLPNLAIHLEIPIPLVVLRSPRNDPAKKIVAPPPQQAARADVRPSIHAPNHETALADLRISSTPFVTTMPVLPPSTTSPIVVRGPLPIEQVPETSSRPAATPTPARIVSLSDLQLQQGTIALPLINERASSAAAADVAGQASNAPVSSGKPSNNQSGGGARSAKLTPGGAGAGHGGSGTAAHAAPSSANGRGVGTGLAPQANASAGQGLSTDHITRPKDGQFGVVVVDSSLADEYPEMLGVLSSRLAYTVYVEVGLGKSWILQYALPRPVAAASGAARPQAPWPYDIVRPNLAPGDLNADALMVHGFVDATGRFEHLAVVFPPQFAQTKFVLHALQQWQFRPATQNGQNTTVEVLLIIPDELDESD